MPNPTSQSSLETDRATAVWDLPTRLFHWTLLLLVAFSWGSAEYDQMELHRYSGYAVFGLLLFRLFWGLVGSSTARFSSFLSGPQTVLRYSRQLLHRPAHPTAGHNPMGGWSVVALLLALTLQVATGLFAVDADGLESGPLSHLVSFSLGRDLAEVHEVAFNLLLTLVALHVAAILFYRIYHGENLVSAMFTGRKRVQAADAAGLHFAPLWRAIAGLAAAALLVWLVVR
jgi:cytochrome b